MLNGAENMYEQNSTGQQGIVLRSSAEAERIKRLVKQGRNGGSVSFIELDLDAGVIVDYVSGMKIPLDPQDVERFRHPQLKSLSKPLPTSPASLESSVEDQAAAFEASFEKEEDVAFSHTESVVLQLKKESGIDGLCYLASMGGAACVVDREHRIYTYTPSKNLTSDERDSLLGYVTFAVRLAPDQTAQYDTQTGIVHFSLAKTPTFARWARRLIGGMRISGDDLVVLVNNGDAAEVIADFQEAASELVPRAFDTRVGVAVFGNRQALAKHPDYLRSNHNYTILGTHKLTGGSMRYQDWSERIPPVERYV